MHLQLHTALARRRNWQSLGAFNKHSSFENRGALKIHSLDTEWFMLCGRYCCRWFPMCLWSKDL